MKRRSFIKNTTFCVVAVSTSGFIRFDGNRYEGDCETTPTCLDLITDLIVQYATIW